MSAFAVIIDIRAAALEERLRRHIRPPGLGYTPRGKLATVLERDGVTCCWCGRDVDLTQEFTAISATLEHVVPRARGGMNEVENLRVACHECNHSRGDGSAWFNPLLPPSMS